MLGLLLLLSCQAPFGHDRHDLVGDRIAAIEIAGGVPGEPIHVRPAIIADSRFYTDSPVQLRWYWLADHDDLSRIDPQRPPDAVGPAPDLSTPADMSRLGLVVEFDGTSLLAEITVPTQPGPLLVFEDLASHELPLSVHTLDEDSLAVDEREDLVAGVVSSVVQPGAFLRFQAEVPGADRTRWMSQRGTWLEFDPFVADWAAGDLTLDDGEVEQASELSAGSVGILVSAFSEHGTTAWRPLEIHVGERPAGLDLNGWWLPSEVVPDEPWVEATLVADDGSASGLRLEDAIGLADAPADFGTAALPCLAPVDGAFDPTWMLDGSCTRAAVIGHRVVVHSP